MSWLKIDDGFAENKRVQRLSANAFRLHVIALCYCARNLTDGRLDTRDTKIVCAVLDAPRPARYITELLREELWAEVDGGYEIGSYLEYNPSAEVVKEERRKARVRMQNTRRKKQGLDELPEDEPPSAERAKERSGERPNEQSGEGSPSPSRPVPSRSSASNEAGTPGAEVVLLASGEPRTPVALVSAQTLLGEFVDGARGVGIEPPDRFKGHLSRELKRLLEEGQSPEAVRAGMARMVERRVMQPSLLPNFVMEAQLPARPASSGSQRYGRGVSTETILDMAARAAAEEREAS